VENRTYLRVVSYPSKILKQAFFLFNRKGPVLFKAWALKTEMPGRYPEAEPFSRTQLNFLLNRIFP